MRASLSANAESRFRIVAQLGSGGFGAVSEAVDSRTGQRVALKELGDVSASSVARFKQEFRALADCHHPNLVGLKELIESDGRWTIVMELVPGSDFVSHVRGPSGHKTFDEAKLRQALSGMARGLATLHGHGILHRDLKPPNVRVTPEGRAVLLDFGLATSIDPNRQAAYVGGLGTVAYMAPEQVTGAHVGPAVDWYALGVCLFEALTGRRPFESDVPYQILTDKQQLTAPRASTLAANVPPDLDELCAQLLERQPDRRADAAAVFETLGTAYDEDASIPLPGATPQAPFKGRDAELIHLERVLARTYEGAYKVAFVEGESGMGKSELVQEFVRRAQANDPNLLALHGRCYENEQVSYKAFDGCIDELARFLRHLPEASCAPLLPAGAVLLGQLFPVLRTVTAIAGAPAGEWSLDPTARRLEAFSALIGLLRKVAEERTLILIVDDLQWADTESFRLLLALAEAPEPPPLLVVGTIRPPEELEEEVASALEAVRRKHRIEVVQIHGLPMQQAAELARSLLGPNVPDAYCHLIAMESGGHPLFLSELVQYVQSHDFAAHSALTIEAALRARIERLDAPSRALLEIAALAGRPYGSHIFTAALSVDSIDDPARTLLASRLLRLRKSQELGCYHDRIRHSAVSMIPRTELRGLHERLARALSTDPSIDAVDRARHWDLAGDRDKAVASYDEAAAAAFAALAFLRSADLCARALELLGEHRDERTQHLLERRAAALACAGRSGEAATLYERAIEGTSGHARFVLRERHAAQLIVAGRLELGIGLMRSLLEELGVRLPRTNFGTAMQILFYRAFLAIRRRASDRDVVVPGSTSTDFTVRVLHNFGVAISPFDALSLILVTLRGIRLVPRAASSELLSSVYIGLGWLRAMNGKPSAALFDKSHLYATQTGNPTTVANVDFSRGSALLMNFEAEASKVFLERAQHTLQTRSTDQTWLLRNVRYLLGSVWYLLGEHRRVAEESERWIVEARERNDQLSVGLYAGMGFGFVRHLMRDAPDDVHTEFQIAMREAPKDSFTWLHWGELFATVNALLYKGGPLADEWFTARAREHRRTMLLKLHYGRTTMALYRALAALHAYESRGERQRAAIVKRVHKLSKQVQKNSSPAMRVYAKLLRAQAYVLRRDFAKALECARAALAVAPGYADYQKRLAQYLVGLLESRDERDPRCESVVQAFRAQGWRNPHAFLRLLLPTIRYILPRGSIAQVGEARADIKNLGGRFELLGSLGAGGFGEVVKARDVQSGRLVALKELVSKSARSLERFKQEFRAIRDVHHPNLVRLDSLLEHEGAWYIAMELLSGEPLLAYTRPGGAPDLARICRVYHALAGGLIALHEAGFAHRDVTERNVRVTEEGRAVLLDFGLIGRLGDRRDEGAVGSVEYAAPEQLRGRPPSAAADVYGLGTCLYQSLSGRLPFEAENVGRLYEKKQTDSPLRRAPEGFEALEALALEMLATAPAARPTLAETRERLRALVPEQPTVVLPVIHLPEPQAEFSGRDEELEWLDDAFERTCDDGLTVALVEGESGLGKSALVAEFARRIEGRYPHALLLRSRCYESELVAYKAFDAAIDQLARALRALPNPACEALMPKRAALLADLFPVLNTVPVVHQAPKRGLPAEPGVRQRAAIGCLIELLSILTQRFELMFVIDDLQWADSESFRLLRLLLEHRATLPLLIVATLRPSREITDEVASELATLRASGATSAIALEGLSDDAATELVQELCDSDALPPERLRALVDEAKGHPLFLRELVEQQRAGAVTHENLTLDEALKARIQSYDAQARTLLSLVALAGRPCDMHVFARALDGVEPGREIVADLLARGLLRRSGSDALATYHDRIARVILDLLSPVERRTLAGRLAEALEREPTADPSECARLWEEAGDAERAARAYEHAADRALATLQFARAEQSYRRALALAGTQHDERWCALTARRGDALVRAGRGSEAGEAYAAAAQHAPGELGVQLRILAAEQAIVSAQAERGLAAAHALLSELGLKLPRRPTWALLSLYWLRFRVQLRGRDVRAPRSALTATTRVQLDAAWSLAFPLSWLDPLSGTLLSMHHLRIALACGEPTHVARALAANAFARAVWAPEDKTCDVLLAEARSLASTHGGAALEAEVMWREGVSATYRGQLTVSCERLESALSILTERCPDQPWLLTNTRLSLGSVWFNRAEHIRLVESATTWLADARERGDEFAQSTLYGLGYGFVASLMNDDPDAVAEEVARHRDQWPKQPFSFVRFGDLIATTGQLLYRGGDLALCWYEKELPAMAHAPLLRAGHSRAFVLFSRAMAHLNAYAAGPRAGSIAQLQAASKLARELARVQGAMAAVASPYVAAQVHVVEGRPARARAALDDAASVAAAGGQTLHADRISYLRATLDGGAEAEQTRKQLLARYAQQGWRRPRRAIAMFCPVLDIIEPGAAARDGTASEAD